MSKDMRGTDVVIIGALAYLIWQAVKSPLNQGCLPANLPTGMEPQSSMVGPAWTQNPVEEQTT